MQSSELEDLLTRLTTHNKDLEAVVTRLQEEVKRKNVLLREAQGALVEAMESVKARNEVRERFNAADVVLFLEQKPIPDAQGMLAGVKIEVMVKGGMDWKQPKNAAQALADQWLRDLEKFGEVQNAWGDAPAPFIKPRLVPQPKPDQQEH